MAQWLRRLFLWDTCRGSGFESLENGRNSDTNRYTSAKEDTKLISIFGSSNVVNVITDPEFLMLLIIFCIIVVQKSEKNF